MDELLRRQVWERAANCCEYCRLPQALHVLQFQIDHILALKHHGLTELDNLALSCCDCNVAKGPNISGFDFELNAVTRLYHPRRDAWHEHFQWRGAMLVGITPEGRVTVDVLNTIWMIAWNNADS